MMDKRFQALKAPPSKALVTAVSRTFCVRMSLHVSSVWLCRLCLLADRSSDNAGDIRYSLASDIFGIRVFEVRKTGDSGVLKKQNATTPLLSAAEAASSGVRCLYRIIASLMLVPG